MMLAYTNYSFRAALVKSSEGISCILRAAAGALERATAMIHAAQADGHWATSSQQLLALVAGTPLRSKRPRTITQHIPSADDYCSGGRSVNNADASFASLVHHVR